MQRNQRPAELHAAVQRIVEALRPEFDAAVLSVGISVAATPDELAEAFPREVTRARHVYAGDVDGDDEGAHTIDSARVLLERGRVTVTPGRIKRRPVAADEQLALRRQRPATPAITLPWERA